MTRQSKIRSLVAIVLLTAGVCITLAISGCGSDTTTGSTPSTQPLFGFLPPAPDKSGSQLWAENCSRCHNFRPPQEFSNAQWATIVHHMRLRANLTGEEARKITQFLQASD